MTGMRFRQIYDIRGSEISTARRFRILSFHVQIGAILIFYYIDLYLN